MIAYLLQDVEITIGIGTEHEKNISCAKAVSITEGSKDYLLRPCNNPAHPIHLNPASVARILSYRRKVSIKLPEDLSHALHAFSEGSPFSHEIGATERRKKQLENQLLGWFEKLA